MIRCWNKRSSLVGPRVPAIADRRLSAGDRWIYSAGFNVSQDLKNTIRIDEEIDDLRRLITADCKVSLISHQGNYLKRTAQHLNFVADYLSRRLGRVVRYVPETISLSAQEIAGSMKNGEIILFGNTRLYPGEEKNCSEFAKELSKLGDRIVIGGFCKSHRKHSSNVGVLDFLPGWASEGLFRQSNQLRTWIADRDYGPSLAVLGGTKREKIDGLGSMASAYSYIIPGGAVLNTILKHLGMEIGESFHHLEATDTQKHIDAVWRSSLNRKILLPDKLVITPAKALDPRYMLEIPFGNPVPNGFKIVDFEPTDTMRRILDNLATFGGRMLLAGPPCLYPSGFQRAANPVLKTMTSAVVDSMLLGGDSVSELPFTGEKSSGGGASLRFLCTATTEVFEALKLTHSDLGDCHV